MATAPVSVLGLATAVPDHVLEQSAVADFARRIYAKSFARYPKLAEVFVNAGIERRYSVRPLEWFDAPHDWSERTQAYLDGAGMLFVSAAERALAQAGISAQDVDVIVTVSSTGIATPSLEARVGGELGFRASAARVPVFGLGCAGGVSGLAIGARLARAEPGEVVLVVAVELCTLAFRHDRAGKADVISSALFGDGSAAVVLRAEPEPAPLSVGVAAQHTWPGTLDIMGWSVDPAGFGVILSRSLPRFVEQRLAAPVRRFLKDARIDAPRLICHPGGAKVLDAIETALELQKGTLRDEREMLRDYGNMSAPTALFVLERARKRGLRGQAVLSALGPGFTASFLALEAA
ncbi:MAG TPA: type III polyketide synthase [Steroidobacteraceae bacterium]|jgi:alkylresorcinol/alkylpyrone synthase|nr:type III polyketide synthase [Steroidobacteraceae bacterium]